MSLRPTRRDWMRARRDLIGGLAARQIWLRLGFNDIRVRYSRSRFGQFWITLSMGIFIGGIGLVYSVLFKQPIHEYLPYLAVNITVWTLISGIVGESSTLFVQSSMYMRQDALPKTIFVMRILVRNFIVFCHNIVLIPLVFIIFGYAVSLPILYVVPGIAVLVVATFLMALVIGMLSTRFRDLPQIIQNLLQLLFFVTPIMWRIDQVGDNQRALVAANPIAALLKIVAEPILGRVPSVGSYVTSIIFIASLMAIGLPLFARYRSRIVYWL